jgi:hypothetical protein
MANKRIKGRKLQTPAVKGDWLTQLAENLELQPAPPGWYTLSQIAQHLKIGRTATKRILLEKKAMRQKFYHKTQDGRIIPTVHYKL